jgi:hypothetical protein
MYSDQIFEEITKQAEETASIEEIKRNLGISVKIKNKLSSKVKPNDLIVDSSYQREINKIKVANIIKNYNPNAIGVVTLSIRENGDLYIIDGQHRVEALKQLGFGSNDINAIVFFDLTIQDEAQLFVIMNESRTKPKKSDLYKASIKSGDNDLIELNNMLNRNNVTVGDKPGDCIIRAIGTLHKVNNKLGIINLEKVVKVLISANGNNSTSFQAEYITAVSTIIVKYKNLDMDRLALAIKKLGEPSLAIHKSHMIASDSKSVTKSLTLSAMIIDMYNSYLKKNKLDKYIVLSSDAKNYLSE